MGMWRDLPVHMHLTDTALYICMLEVLPVELLMAWRSQKVLHCNEKKTPNSEVWHKCKWFGGCLLRGVLCQLGKLLPQDGEDGGCVRTNLEAEVLHP